MSNFSTICNLNSHIVFEAQTKTNNFIEPGKMRERKCFHGAFSSIYHLKLNFSLQIKFFISPFINNGHQIIKRDRHTSKIIFQKSRLSVHTSIRMSVNTSVHHVTCNILAIWAPLFVRVPTK